MAESVAQDRGADETPLAFPESVKMPQEVQRAEEPVLRALRAPGSESGGNFGLLSLLPLVLPATRVTQCHHLNWSDFHVPPFSLPVGGWGQFQLRVSTLKVLRFHLEFCHEDLKPTCRHLELQRWWSPGTVIALPLTADLGLQSKQNKGSTSWHLWLHGNIEPIPSRARIKRMRNSQQSSPKRARIQNWNKTLWKSEVLNSSRCLASLHFHLPSGVFLTVSLVRHNLI